MNIKEENKVIPLVIKILITLIVIYYLQGIMYSSDSFISKIVLILFLGTCVFFLIKVYIRGYANYIVNLIILFIAMNLLWLLFSTISPSANLRSMVMTLKATSIALLPLFPFYYAGCEKYDIKKILIIFLFIYIGISIFSFYKMGNLMMNNLNKEQVVNNIGYNFVLLMPYLLLIKKRKIIILPCLMIMIYYLSLSSKRGAILCFIGAIIIYFVYIYKHSEMNKNKALGIFFLLLTITLSFAYYTISQNEYMISRFDSISEKTSGRDIIFNTIYNHFENNTSAFTILFGSGYGATLDIIGAYAHNDLLEIIINFGLLGLTLYLILVGSFIKWSTSKKISSEHRYIVLMISIIWILKFITTGVFTAENTFLLSILLGYIIGLEHSKNIKHENIMYY